MLHIIQVKALGQLRGVAAQQSVLAGILVVA